MSKPRQRKLAGVRFRPTRVLAYVSVRVNGVRRQEAKSFPADVEPDTVIGWQADTRKRLRKGTAERGTLAADILKHLNDLPDSRRKRDLAVWLNRWAATPLGKAPRGSITRDQVTDQLRAWRPTFSGSSLNHAKQALLTLWRELDGRGHSCPALHISRFAEGEPRSGFFETEKLAKVLAALPQDYQDVIQFASLSGWRKSEVCGLRWDEIDLTGKQIRLRASRSKNREGRVLPLTGQIEQMITRRFAGRGENPLPVVFTRVYGGKRTKARVVPVGDFRKTWTKACKAAGCEGALIHDLRRTVVRNLIRAGVSERVAMQITGHKTRAVFQRYDITSDRDLVQACERLSDYVEQQTPKGDGTGAT